MDVQYSWHIVWKNNVTRYNNSNVIFIITVEHCLLTDYIKMEPANITRCHNSKRVKSGTNKRLRQNFLAERPGNKWNRLPADIVNAPSLNAFKSRIDKHWSQYRYGQRSPHEDYMFTRWYIDRVDLRTGLAA